MSPRRRKIVVALLVLCPILALVGGLLFPGIGARLREVGRTSWPLTSVEEKLAVSRDLLAKFLKERGLSERPRNISLRIVKSSRLLELKAGDTVLKTYKIVLGSVPKGHKEREGDGRTPVGEYYVCTKNERSKFYLFLGISYPGKEDAERGLKSGLIDSATKERICAAIDAMRCPPWDTPLGGEIGIHGGGTDRDWTRGCIALENSDIAELWGLVELGTPVTIME